MASVLNTLTKINNRRLAGPPIDVNADVIGRPQSGDPRIDLAVADRR